MYSFAILSNYILMKSPPYTLKTKTTKGNSQAKIMRWVIQENERPILATIEKDNMEKEITTLITIIQKCWHRNPHMRPNVIEVTTDLRKFSKGVNSTDHVVEVNDNTRCSQGQE